MTRSLAARLVLGGTVLAAAAAAVPGASADGRFDDGTNCKSYSTPNYTNDRLQSSTGTTSFGCEYRSTVAGGYQAKGGFRLTLTRAGHKIVIAAKNGVHCGAVGTIQKGDWVAAYAESATTRFSNLKTGPQFHC
jgi:hypothetical protein